MRIPKEAGTGEAWTCTAWRLLVPLFATDKPSRKGVYGP